MLELVIVVVRAFTLALRGHRELVLENLALRQQLAAVHFVPTASSNSHGPSNTHPVVSG